MLPGAVFPTFSPSHSQLPSICPPTPPTPLARRYGIPAKAAAAFEAALRAALPDQVEAHPDLLFHLVTLLSPRILQQQGVPVCGVTQVRVWLSESLPRGLGGILVRRPIHPHATCLSFMNTNQGKLSEPPPTPPCPKPTPPRTNPLKPAGAWPIYRYLPQRIPRRIQPRHQLLRSRQLCAA
jgi:hypothetical protein